MKKSFLLATSFFTALMLSACNALDAGKVLIGISQVNQAPACLQTLKDYLPEDRLPDRELEFFEQAYAGAIAFGFSESFLSFVADSPEFMRDAGKNFGEIERTVGDYSTLSGKPIPADLIACGRALETGWQTLEAAVRESDTSRKVVEYARLIKAIVI